MVELDHSYRERVQKYQLHTYMYGYAVQPPAGVTTGTLGGEALSDLVLSPSSTVIKFGDLSIFRIGTGKSTSNYSRKKDVDLILFGLYRDDGSFICIASWGCPRCV